MPPIPATISYRSKSRRSGCRGLCSIFTTRWSATFPGFESRRRRRRAGLPRLWEATCFEAFLRAEEGECLCRAELLAFGPVGGLCLHPLSSRHGERPAPGRAGDFGEPELGPARGPGGGVAEPRCRRPFAERRGHSRGFGRERILLGGTSSRRRPDFHHPGCFMLDCRHQPQHEIRHRPPARRPRRCARRSRASASPCSPIPPR